MSKAIRVYLIVAVLAVIGLFIGLKVPAEPNYIVAIGIPVLALAGGLYLLRRESADEGDFFETPKGERAEPDEPAASTATATAEPLATWDPSEGGLATWTPPEEDEAPAASTTFVEEEEEEPLDVLDLEELEPIDEFVEAEAAEQAEPDIAVIEEEVDVEVDVEVDEEPELVGAEAHATVIDEIEDVHSDDDIMKASHATELSVTAPEASDNSELAKLLAKVQSRLAAYE